ncbi:hypothetical protein [Streptomyces sp. NPDC049915]|uniref:hypothetical protein n=1 Tax=Streptomyces sp. NPDC049915 TaxID=3155510 RepID=UPI0034459A73
MPDPKYGTAENQAQRLEQWLLQHTGPADHWYGDEHPVTGGLPRHTTTSMLVLTDGVGHRLLHDQLVPDPQAQADVCERRVALYERLSREGDAPPEAAEWIAKDRARAAALRATPGNGVPWQTMGDIAATQEQPEP